MRLIPATHRRAERTTWFVVATVLVLSAVAMLGLWN